MRFDRNSIIRLLITILISIGIYAAMTELFSSDPLTWLMLVESVALGAAIWLVSEVSIELVQRKWPHKTLPGYVALFVIIALGTGVGAWLLGVESLGVILLICGCAEVFGMSIAIGYRRYYRKRINDRLKTYQSKNMD